MTIRSVGFIGLGTMGAGMVANLVRAGVEVRGFNRTVARSRALADELGSSGFSVADRPAVAARGADAVLLCLGSDAAVEAVMFGEDGAGEALGAGTLLVDTGTTSLELTRRLDALAASRGAAFVDAPITGSKLGAEGGKLTFMVGGPRDAFDRLAPLCEIMGKHAVHVDEAVGAGQRAKYCLNMTQAVVLQGVLEGYALAVKSGVPMAKLAEIFEHSAGKTGVGSFKTPYLQTRDFAPHFRLALMGKDLHLARALAEAGEVPLPLASRVTELYDRAVAAGLGDEDFLAMAKLLERDGDLRLGGEGEA